MAQGHCAECATNQAFPRITGAMGRFHKAYLAEARANPALAELRKLAGRQRLTLLYGWHDTEHNHAMLLADLLGKR